jgi:hypothetical protein
MKMLDKILKNISDNYGDVFMLQIHGFDDAVIGYEENSMRLIYSVTSCIEILIQQGLSFTESLEHFEINVKGSFTGEKAPIFCYDNF